MQAALDKINSSLSALLGEYDACVSYQSGDGWCVVFDDDHNAPIALMDLDKLLTMNKKQAIEYLHDHSI